jgi:hypothetical protein
VKQEQQDLKEKLVHKVCKDPRAIPVIPARLVLKDRLEKLAQRAIKAIRETPEKLVQLERPERLEPLDRLAHKDLKEFKALLPRGRSVHFYSSKLGKPHGTKEKQTNGNI